MKPKKSSIRFSSGEPAAFLSQINRSPFYRTISMQLDATGKKGSLVKIELSRKHNNALGIAHGGVIASLIDSACSMCVIPHLREDEMIVTTGLQIQYYFPVSGEGIVGRGRLLHYGRRVVYAEADVEDPKRKIIARGVASFLIIKNTAGKGEKG